VRNIVTNACDNSRASSVIAKLFVGAQIASVPTICAVTALLLLVAAIPAKAQSNSQTNSETNAQAAAHLNPPQGPQNVPSPAGNAGNGKKLFAAYGCFECHGHEASGGAGPHLAPNPVPFSTFARYVRHPSGTMPPYTAKVASDQDLSDIYAFLKSVPDSLKAKVAPPIN
jgi:mono/diheme cytochrome c family protein